MMIPELMQRLERLAKKARLALAAQSTGDRRLRPALVPQGVRLANEPVRPPDAQPVWDDDGGR